MTTSLAAAGDTWGIPGPIFLAIFLAVAAVVVIGSMVHRAILFAGRRPPGYDRLSPQQAAYLGGGDQLAVYTALGGLRAAGVIGARSDRTLARIGSMPAGVTPLDQAIYDATGKRVRSRALMRDPRVVAALSQLREGLQRSGLALDPQARHAARIGPLLLLGLLVIGLMRVFAGFSAGKPVAFLVLTLLALSPIFLVQMLRVPRRTRAATSALSSLRAQHSYLAPTQAPAYATYGAAGAAMGVALFGAATLWALDPAFAAEAELQRQVAPSSGGGSYAGDSSSSSSCGGGSSDSGGGGGCGGGGGGGGCGG